MAGRGAALMIAGCRSKYRGAHAASRAKTGFRIYVIGSRGGGGRAAPHPRVMEEFL
jgi:hypothetical protein